MDRELIYVADPMCSWCYGFGPELASFQATCDLPTRLVLGGLWAGGGAQPMGPELKAYLRDVWTRVGSMSGQPFSFDLLEWEGWTYDTGPACRAVVTMRSMAPDHEHRFFGALQYAFYGENRDLVDEFTYPDLLEGYPVDVADFMLMFRSTEIETASRADFDEAKSLGAVGFPTLLLRSGDTYTPLARGFTRSQQIGRIYEVLGGD